MIITMNNKPYPHPLLQRAAEAAMTGIRQDDWFHYRHFGTWSYEGGNGKGSKMLLFLYLVFRESALMVTKI